MYRGVRDEEAWSNTILNNPQSVLDIYIDDEEEPISHKYVIEIRPKGTLFNKLELGSTVCQSLEIKLHVDSGIESANKVRINYGIYIGDEIEMIPIGIYNVYDASIEKDNVLILKCSDNVIKFDDDNGCYDSEWFVKSRDEVTYAELAADICNSRGLELATTEFLNSSQVVTIYDTSITARELMGYIAEKAGGFVCAGRDGRIYIKTLGSDSLEIPLRFFKNYTFGDKFTISKIAYENGVESWKPGDDSGNTIWLDQENLYITDESDVDNIYEELVGLEFYSFEGSTRIDPRIDIGDFLIIDGKPIIYQGEMVLSKTFFANIKSKIDSKNKQETTKRIVSQKFINRRVEGRINEAEGFIKQLISEMYEEDGVINSRFTEVLQNIVNIVNSVQNSGGNNLLKNSVMFAYDSENNPENWIVEGNGNLTIKSSTEAYNNGGLSGHVFILEDKKAIQRVFVKSDNNDIPEDKKTYYTFSTKISKNITGSCYIKISNTQEEHYIELPEGVDSFFGDYELKLLPKDNYYDIEFYGSADSNATFTDNMFSVGEYKTQWQQANGEIMNTQVIINQNGVLTKSSVFLGDYTVMSPLEFSGYSNINGTITKVFTLNKDTTVVKKLESEDEIKMAPIKIIPITEGELQGWAFVPSSTNREV